VGWGGGRGLVATGGGRWCVAVGGGGVSPVLGITDRAAGLPASCDCLGFGLLLAPVGWRAAQRALPPVVSVRSLCGCRSGARAAKAAPLPLPCRGNRGAAQAQGRGPSTGPDILEANNGARHGRGATWYHTPLGSGVGEARGSRARAPNGRPAGLRVDCPAEGPKGSFKTVGHFEFSSITSWN
jgi:hypothetical protein